MPSLKTNTQESSVNGIQFGRIHAAETVRPAEDLGFIDEGKISRKMNKRTDCINHRVVRIGGHEIDTISAFRNSKFSPFTSDQSEVADSSYNRPGLKRRSKRKR
jgi:hypothetical protein